jgi:acyl-CoA hydrolase
LLYWFCSKILINALAQRARNEDLRELVLHHLHVEGHNPFDDEDLSQKGNSHHFFIGKNSRKAVNEGRGAYIPCFLSDIPVLLRHHRVPLDWAFLNVSPPDKHGFCSLGTEVCAARAASDAALRVVAQINPNVPRTLGHAALHISNFDYVVDVSGNPDAKIPTVPVATPGEAEMKMGDLLADMIPNGACLQVGIGSVPNAVLKRLINHKNLGVHSEMISDGIMDLIKAGVVNNIEKSFMQHKTVTSFLVGSKDLYDFVDDNPGVHLDDAVITNTPSIIKRNSKVVAINSALEIDLTGQVCADSIGTRMISGIGGQLDFEYGASLSEGGFPIICLPSVTKDKKSTIVNTLKPGAGVTTTRYHAHWICTEYGVVNVWGKDLHERARLLISIAHPDHREQLFKEAFERFKLTK